MSEDETGKAPCPHGAYILRKEADNKINIISKLFTMLEANPYGRKRNSGTGFGQ